MVTCKLWGGLGNQMFMIAAVIGYAKKHSLEYHIPPVSADRRIWKTYFPHLVNKNYNRRHMPTIELFEIDHSYHEIPFREEYRKCNLVLNGYFQSEKYFEGIKDSLAAAFLIVQAPSKWVSIHVRRGDYLKYPDKHPVLPMDYYLEAMSYFPDSNFIMCSDDIRWCRENFLQKNIVFSTHARDFVDLLLMASSEHNIIANSTFSWWGAYFNENRDKKVIAPKVWFGEGNKHLETKDLIPSTWITI